ncbi:hypothetical protein B4U84_06290 [Westiellopsis prolifica IICB1]|nr:hypothetical protein B4U84_06290 [Westiellopsis prolifica IICB1]
MLLTAIDLHGAEKMIKGFIISYNKDSRDYGGDLGRGTRERGQGEWGGWGELFNKSLPNHK